MTGSGESPTERDYLCRPTLRKYPRRPGLNPLTPKFRVVPENGSVYVGEGSGVGVKGIDSSPLLSSRKKSPDFLRGSTGHKSVPKLRTVYH